MANRRYLHLCIGVYVAVIAASNIANSVEPTYSKGEVDQRTESIGAKIDLLEKTVASRLETVENIKALELKDKAPLIL